MAFHTGLVPDSLKKTLEAVKTGAIFDDTTWDEYMDELESYECWSPLFLVLKDHIANPKKRQAKHYIRLAKIQHQYLEDAFSAAETCAYAVSDLNLDYRSFNKTFLIKVIEPDEYEIEATILQSIYPMLTQNLDLVACLERLCLLYEKKIFEETLLNECYDKLIAIDPKNPKALKYFKMLFTQNNEWGEVIRVLQMLHSSSKHRNDKFRIAQEIAGVYLYQMDLPQKAIEVVEHFCSNSPLDTSTIHFDAYHRLRDWGGCIKVLRESLLKVDSDEKRSIVYYKLGKLEEKRHQKELAIEHYLKSHNLHSCFLEPVENLIDLSLLENDWNNTLKYLKVLQTSTSDNALITKIDEALQRISDGLVKTTVT